MPESAAMTTTGIARRLPLHSIVESAYQARKVFDVAQLEGLACSIQQVGLLSPLTVRETSIGQYELICGERRLRACRLLGYTHVDVLVWAASDLHSALASLTENLQRENLHFLEEAEGYQQVMEAFSLSQESLAEALGKRQGTICNKVRLLRLSSDIREELWARGLSERHARLLLNVPETMQMAWLERMSKQHMSVQQAERTVAAEVQRPRRRVMTLIRDVRVYVNAIKDIAGQMRSAGWDVSLTEEGGQEEIAVVLRMRRG